MAGDGNSAAHVYPDQSLYPSNSVPLLVERINNALQRADQVRVVHNMSRSGCSKGWRLRETAARMQGGLQQPVLAVASAAGAAAQSSSADRACGSNQSVPQV